MATSLVPYDDSGKAMLDYSETRQRPTIAGAKLWAFIVILVFFGGFAAWSAWFPLSSAAIAPGVVSPEGDRRTVQHLEGGIISRIHVQEGARIEAGDLLISLDSAQAKAAFDIQESRYVTLMAVKARLEAERSLIVDPKLADSDAVADDAPRIPFPPELASMMAKAELAAVLRNQTDLFKSRRAVMLGKEAVARQEIAQLNEKIRGLNDEIVSLKQEDALVEDQLEGLVSLHKKGHAPKTRVIELQRQNVRLDGAVGERRAKIAEARVQIAKAERAIITDRESFLNEANRELMSVQANLADIEARMDAAADRLNRVEIRAPHAGVVMDLRFTTDQGVIGQGEPILDIVPEDAELLVDARVAPSDIDNVALGQRARIVLPAYGRRAQGLIYGEVVYLAADRLIDETTGAPYFPVRIKVDQSTLVQEDEVIALRPGLAAEIFILTGERTAFDYIADPFLQSLDRSFKEI